MTQLRRRVYFSVLAVFVGLVLFGAFFASRGAIDTYRLEEQASAKTVASSPAWAARCLRQKPRSDRPLLERCTRIRGRVLWVKSNGEDKLHVLLVARFKLFLAKFSPPPRDGPGLGGEIVVTGPLVRSRNGLGEVEVVDMSR